MILPNDDLDCFAPRNLPQTQKPPVVPVAPVADKIVFMVIKIGIPVSANDAKTDAEAVAFASDLARDLELKVTLGGVECAANFMGCKKLPLEE